MSNKYTLVCRPVQSGKTFICIQEVKRDLEANPDSIHIILTMNTICSNNQFANRVIKLVQDVYGKQSVVIFNSKRMPYHPDTNAGVCKINTIGEMADLFMDGNPRIIIMCCHKVRITDYQRGVMRLLTYAERMGKTVKIHIDEIHKYIGPEYRYAYEDFHAQECVESIRFYTATPRPVFVNRPGWRSMQVLDQQEFLIDNDQYFGVRDSTHCQVEIKDIPRTVPIPELTQQTQDTASYEGSIPMYREWGRMCLLGDEISHLRYVQHVLQNCERLHEKNDIFYFGFIPGTGRRVTHIEISNIVFGLAPSAHVCIINGQGIQLHYFIEGVRHVDKLRIDMQSEINEELCRYMREERPEVLRHPFIITGEICVGMSVSLVHSYYGNFHAQVLTHTWQSDEDLYQLCRMCFSYKNWTQDERSKITKTKFYCPGSTISICREYEQTVFDLLEKHVGDIEHFDVGMTVLPDMLEQHLVAFDTFEEAKDFIKQEFNGTGPSKKKYHQFDPMKTEFYLAGRPKKGTIADFDEVMASRAWGLRKDIPWRLCVCYEDLEDSDSIKWVVAHV